MDLMRAFTQMLAGVTAADASLRQVRGILVWREHVHTAVRCGPGDGGHAEGMAVGAVPESVTHRGWRGAAEMILDALYRQACAADTLAAEAATEAAEADILADSYEAAAASADDDGAAVLLAAALAAREAAKEARRRAGAAMAWNVAALDAHTTGTRLVADENAIAASVGQALAAAGGVGEVYGAKHALTTDGRSAR